MVLALGVEKLLIKSCSDSLSTSSYFVVAHIVDIEVSFLQGNVKSGYFPRIVWKEKYMHF